MDIFPKKPKVGKIKSKAVVLVVFLGASLFVYAGVMDDMKPKETAIIEDAPHLSSKPSIELPNAYDKVKKIVAEIPNVTDLDDIRFDEVDEEIPEETKVEQPERVTTEKNGYAAPPQIRTVEGKGSFAQEFFQPPRTVDPYKSNPIGWGSPKDYRDNRGEQPVSASDPMLRTNEMLASLINQNGEAPQNSQERFLAEAEKRKDIYLDEPIEKPISPYQVMSGTIIPCVMVSGINSDLPNEIKGQVRENVYDTVTGKHLLIPQGTTVMGLYDSGVKYGQERVLKAWNRLIFPNGESIQLRGMKGSDLGGYAGLTGEVDNHLWKLTKAVFLSAFLAVGVEKASDGSTFGDQLGGDINRSGGKIVQRQLDVNPTIRTYPGQKFNIIVTRDMILKPYNQSLARR